MRIHPGAAWPGNLLFGQGTVETPKNPLAPGGAAPADDPHRHTQRYPHREAIKFREPYGIDGMTVDIGAGGIGVEVPIPLSPGDAVVLELFDGHAIALGTVRWARPEGSGFRVGIQFTEQDWSIIARIQALRGLKA